MKDKLEQATAYLELALETENPSAWYEVGACKEALTLINEIRESLNTTPLYIGDKYED